MIRFMASLFRHKKYAIVEEGFYNYGAGEKIYFPPEVVDTGPLWRLKLSIAGWGLRHPFGWIQYVSETRNEAVVLYTSSVGVRQRIVIIGGEDELFI